MTTFYSVWQLAEVLDVNWHVAKDWTYDGVTPRPVLVGNYARWRASDLEQWANSSCPALPPMNLDEMAEFQGAIIDELLDLKRRKVA
jgi:hypothetical protein